MPNSDFNVASPVTPTSPAPRATQEILNIKGVCRGFKKTQGDLLVLDDVNLSLREGEIVGLLGRSGSGKSTLLRIIAGLIEPTTGDVTYKGKPLEGPADGVAMVFQTFALFPWLTVLQNVEAGLEAQGVGAGPRRERALAAIDLIGLDGFENAYPRELSGGMRQRVGFARAGRRPDVVADGRALLRARRADRRELAYRPARSLDARQDADQVGADRDAQH